MATYVVSLLGGPCDGEHRTISDKTLAAGQLTCQGSIYVKSDAFPAEENIVFATPDRIAAAVKGPSTAHVTQAWTRWMRALGHRGPQSHRRMVAATGRVRRIARHR